MSTHLRVNPIACDRRGVCAELLPEMVRLDEWGFPLVDRGPVPRELHQHVRVPLHQGVLTGRQQLRRRRRGGKGSDGK